MPGSTVLISVAFVAILIACTYQQIRENRTLIAQGKNKAGGDIKRFVWLRTKRLLSVLAFLMLVIVIYDWQLKAKNDTIATLIERVTQDEQKLAQIPPKPVTIPAVPEKPPASPASVETDYYPPDPSQVIEDVYNPERNSKDRQSVMDGIKKRYEDILVTYMFLKKCNKVNASDYYVIMAALGQEVASINAPGRLQYDILTSAQGSYKEIYSKSRCDGEGIGALYRQYGDYITALSTNAPKLE